MADRAIATVALALTLLGVGCRWLGRPGSPSDSLVASRKLCQEGVAAIEKDRWQEAEALLDHAVRTCPSDPDARRHYAETLWHRGRHRQAIGQLEEACQLAGDNAAFRVRLAEMRLAVGDVELARAAAEAALDLEPKLVEAWTIRGRVARALGKPRQALADFHRALSLSPDDRSVPLEIAEVHRRLNEPERALAALENLADTYSPGQEPQQVLYLEGLAYAALRRWDDAIDSFSAASLRGRPTPEILFQLGQAQWSAGRPSEAAAAARKALALDPAHQPSRELLARVEAADGAQRTLKR